MSIYLIVQFRSFFRMSNGKVVPKSTQVYSRGCCGPRPKFPDPHVQDNPALGPRQRDDYDRGSNLKKDTFVDLDKNSRALWAKHEEHPFSETHLHTLTQLFQNTEHLQNYL